MSGCQSIGFEGGLLSNTPTNWTPCSVHFLFSPTQNGQLRYNLLYNFRCDSRCIQLWFIINPCKSYFSGLSIPSGNLLHSYWTWPFIVSFPIKHVNVHIVMQTFTRGYVNVYHSGNYKWWFSIVMLNYQRDPEGKSDFSGLSIVSCRCISPSSCRGFNAHRTRGDRSSSRSSWMLQTCPGHATASARQVMGKNNTERSRQTLQEYGTRDHLGRLWIQNYTWITYIYI